MIPNVKTRGVHPHRQRPLAVWAGIILFACIVLACMVAVIAERLYVEVAVKTMPQPVPGNLLPVVDRFYYGSNEIIRVGDKRQFTRAQLNAGPDGPWIWLEGDDGFQLEKDLQKCAERVSSAYQREVSRELDGSLNVHFSSNAYIRFDSPNLRHKRWDAVIKDGNLGNNIPFSFSLTRDGPRLQIPFTEEELRAAFGPPTRVQMRAH